MAGANIRRDADGIARAEASQFFKELAESQFRLVQLYEEHGEELPISRLKNLKGEVKANLPSMLGKVDPRHLTWLMLSLLAESGDPLGAAEPWRDTLQHAADALVAGDAAYEVVKPRDDSPFEKAQFKALVADFAAAWHPRDGIEWSLIYQLAQSQLQSQLLYNRWMRMHVDRMAFQGVTDYDLKDQARAAGRGAWVSPRLTESDAIEQAQMMADRFQKSMLRIIRTLRDLRRFTPKVVINNAEQVNVGEQQVNVQQS